MDHLFQPFSIGPDSKSVKDQEGFSLVSSKKVKIMIQETRDIIAFDQADIDSVMTRFKVYDQASVFTIIEEKDRDELRKQALLFFEASKRHAINATEGEAASLAGKYHYKLNKLIPAIFEFIVLEAGAIAAGVVAPPVGFALGVGGPVAGMVTKWGEIFTRLDEDELCVLSTITDLIKDDYRIIRENGVAEEEIRKGVEAKGCPIPDLHTCLEELCGDMGEKKVLIKTRGAGGIIRYTPIR